MAKPAKKPRVRSGQIWLLAGVLCFVGTLHLALHDYSRARGGALGENARLRDRGARQTVRSGYATEVWASGTRFEHSGSLVRAVTAGLTADERSQLTALCGRCLWHSLQTCVRVHGMAESTFVATGDIDDMWLRDSSVQLAIYLPRLRAHPALRGVFEGMLRTQAFYVLQDPYANSFKPRWRGVPDWPSKADRGTGKGGWVAERKYEIDSGAYFLSAMWNYYATPGLISPDTLLKEPAFLEAAWMVVNTITTEQRHNESSSYAFPELPNGGRGNPVGYTGMSWSGFRPSDDATKFGYNIPGNMYAVAALERAVQLNTDVWHDAGFAAAAARLAAEIWAGIEKHGIATAPDGKRAYAYEVDGLGGVLSGFDDPNMPSLLGMPLLGYKHYDEEVYANTRAAILDPAANRLYFKGPHMEGLGSTHTPHGHVWPLAMMVQGLTTRSAVDRITLLQRLLQLQCGNGLMHESVSVHDLGRCTRPWFEWANAMLVVFVENVLGVDCGEAAERHRLATIKEREDAANAAGGQAWPGNHAPEDPLFFETLEASIPHTWVDKSSYETYAQMLGAV